MAEVEREDAPTKEASKFPTETISLPSRGLFYSKDSPLSSGEIELKYMTAREEDILTSRNLIKRGLVYDRLLQSVIVDKDIDPDDLLIADKDTILIVTRMLGYGAEYRVEIQCEDCDEKTDCTVDLADMDIGELEQDTPNNNVFEFVLPISKTHITWKLLTLGDDKKIAEELKALQKIKNADSISSEVTTRLKFLITSVDGDNSMKIIREFVDTRMLSRDSFELRKEVDRTAPNVEVNHTFECDACGHTNVITVPIGLDFFWPSARP